MKKILILFFVLTIILFSGCSNNTSTEQSSVSSEENNDNLATCDKETKKCPDGSLVSKAGLDCKFLDCPLPTNPYKRIEAIIDNLGNYEVSIFDKNSNMTEDALPPFEIIINSDGANCAAAKSITLKVMQSLYTDEISKENIGSVRVNIRRYLSASLGSKEGEKMSKNAWDESSPSVFFQTLEKWSMEEKNDLPLEEQTWGMKRVGCS